MDLERYADEYKNVSKRELAEIREFSASDNTFESKVRCLNMDREMEKIHGKKAMRPGPLVHVLSVRIQPRKDVKKPLVVYGRISVEHFDSTYGVLVGHDLYKRDPSLAEVLDSTGTLTLNGPDFMCHPDSAIIPMFRNKINAELFDEHGNVLAEDCFSLDDTEIEGGYEQVKSTCIPCEQVSLVVAYIAIPFGYSCRLKIRFCSRKVPGKHDSVNVIHDSVNVNGKIVASCVNTYGNYSSEECVLFQKHSNAFERVEIDGAKMLLSRCWVALPAYSSLVIGVNLSEYDTGRKIVNGSVQLLAEPGPLSAQKIILDDMYIQVSVAWFPPTPLGRHEGYDFYPPEKVPINALSSFSPRTQGLPIEEIDEMIDEMDTEEDDETSSPDESLSNPDIHWELRPHKYKPFSSPAIEIFSIFVGREESKAVKLHGSIEVFSEDERVCYLFKRDENDPLFVSEHMETALVPDGSRLYENYNDLEIKFDMKDIGGNVAVKGYAKWDAEILDKALHRDKQLCSFIQGEQGFLALHYSIFSHAVVACPKIFLILKTPSSDVYPKVYGSLTCQYRNHCYSSKYNRDYYRSVLFTKTRGDAVQLNGHGLLPLCRSSVVVPSYSPLIINLDLSIGMWFQKVASVMEIEIGDKSKTVETSDSIIRIEVDWCEIK